MLLSVVLALTVFSATMPATPVVAAMTTDGMFAPLAEIYDEEFTDKSVEDLGFRLAKTLYTGDGTAGTEDSAEIVDGKLRLRKGNNTYSGSNFKYYFAAGTSSTDYLSYDGDPIYVIDLKFAREGNGTILWYLNGNSSVVWGSGLAVAANSNLMNGVQVARYDGTEFYNLKYVVDTAIGGQVSLWSGSTLVSSANTSSRAVQHLYMYVNNERGQNTTYIFDHIKVYTIARAEYESAMSFVNNLTTATVLGGNNSADALTENLNLAAAGSGITWQSDNPALISDTGEVTRPANGYETSLNVTLTATSTANLKKNLVFNVKRVEYNDRDDMDGDYILYDNFDTDEKRNIVYTASGASKGEISGGKLRLTSDASGSNSAASYYFAKDNGTMTGKYVIEFDAKRSNASKRFNVLLMANAGWKRYSQDIYEYSGVFGKSGYVYNTTDTYRFRYIVDTTVPMYSVYIDDVLEHYRVPKMTSDGAANSLQMIMFQLIGGNATDYTLSVDNLKVYKLKDEWEMPSGFNANVIAKDGTVTETIASSGAIQGKASFTVLNTEGELSAAALPKYYMALYEKDTKKLVDVKVSEAAVINSTAYNTAVAGSVPAACYYYKDVLNIPADYWNYEVKTFIWNDNMKPLGLPAKAVGVE
jgi:hypothetical protein